MDEVQVNLTYRWFLCYDLDGDITAHGALSKAGVPGRFRSMPFATEQASNSSRGGSV